MFEPRRGQTQEWSRPLLGGAVAAGLALLVIAIALKQSIVFAAIAAALSLALGAVLAAPRREGTGARAREGAADGAAISGETRALLETMDEPLIVLDRGGRILLANDAARTLVGADSERKHISSVLRTPELLQAISRVTGGGPSESVEFTFFVPVERHFRAYIAPVTRSDGAAGSLLLIQVHDLTAMRRAEAMRVDFVANASHELRTPLASVSGFIDTLRGHARNDPQARDRFLDIMAEEAGRMRRLIDNLLSLTRIELNEHNPPSARVDLVTVVRDAATALAPLAQSDGITIQLPDNAPMPVIGDRDDLVQVFQNLIHNAIKYGRDNGTVRISFGRSQGHTRNAPDDIFASVQDDGEGIPREAIPRLTERFYRVDVKRSRERGGTGLGLAIVKHILNRHRGRLQIESTPGVGSTFTVFLPSAPAEAP
jgi:two-component system phosphate regulon sensor histidine kinase PhoR